jgi:hypothetical protein
MDKDEKLKLDYEQTTNYYHQLADSRFKLLALIPVVTGAAIGLLSTGIPSSVVLVIGCLGFVVTLGLFFYNQRNSQIFDKMIVRAKMLETLLELESLDDGYRYGGPFLSRPDRTLKLFGVIRVWGDRGLALVYGAALGGWAYLISSSLLDFVTVSCPIKIAINVGIPGIIALAFIWQVHEWDREAGKTDALSPKIQKLLQANVTNGVVAPQSQGTHRQTAPRTRPPGRPGNRWPPSCPPCLRDSWCPFRTCPAARRRPGVPYKPVVGPRARSGRRERLDGVRRICVVGHETHSHNVWILTARLVLPG